MSQKPESSLAIPERQVPLFDSKTRPERMAYFRNYLGFMPITKNEERLLIEIVRTPPQKPQLAGMVDLVKGPTKRTINAGRVVTGLFWAEVKRNQADPTRHADPVKEPNLRAKCYEGYAESAVRVHRQLSTMADAVRDEPRSSDSPAWLLRLNPEDKLTDHQIIPATYGTAFQHWLIRKHLNEMANEPERAPDPLRNPFSAAYKRMVVTDRAISSGMDSTTIGEVNQSIPDIIAQEENRFYFWLRSVQEVQGMQPADIPSDEVEVQQFPGMEAPSSKVYADELDIIAASAGKWMLQWEGVGQ